MTLDGIRNPACTACPLHENAANVCVMGSGPIDAKLMIIGQAPGYNEDRLGVPFVGKAGQLLDRELERVGIDRDEVYVTNTAKCYPPGDRPPNRAEMKACRPYLDQEMAAVRPQLTILLGNVAMQGVLATSGIMSKANTIHERDGQAYLPIIHPAAVLRDPGNTDFMRTGLEAARRFLDGQLEGPKTQINLIRTAEDIEQFLNELNDVAEVVAFDIETATTEATAEVPSRKGGGLEPWAPDFIVQVAGFSWEEGVSWVLPIFHWDTPMAVRQAIDPYGTGHLPTFVKDGLLNDVWRYMAPKKIGGHNVKFDLQGLRRIGASRLQAQFDTLLMVHLLDENHKSKGLGALAQQYLGAPQYKDDVKKDGTDPLDKLALYNGRDADYTLRLYRIFREQLIAQPRLARIYQQITLPAQNNLVDVEMHGFPVRVRRLRDRHVGLKLQIANVEREMLEYVPRDQWKHAKWNRSNFLLQFMFETLGLPIVKVTEKGADKAIDWQGASIDEEAMLELQDEHPLIPLLMERTRLAKLESTYTRKWVEALRLTQQPRIYPNYNVTGTVTGRMSSNLQQVPRDNFIRGIITAPPGWMLLEADFSQIELRIAAMLSHDPAMMAVYQRGEDLHMIMASAITGKPPEHVTSEERSRAKPVSFGFLYGMGWRNFIPYARAQFGVVVTPEQAQHYRNSFFLRFPQLVNWHDKQRREVQVLGYVTSPIGRRRRLPTVNSPDKEVREMAERQAINSPVQGFASDLTLLAMNEFAYGRKDGLFDPGQIHMIGQVHDSILFEVTEGYAQEASSTVKLLMETLPIEELFGYAPPVPIVADVKVVKHWGGV